MNKLKIMFCLLFAVICLSTTIEAQTISNSNEVGVLKIEKVLKAKSFTNAFLIKTEVKNVDNLLAKWAVPGEFQYYVDRSLSGNKILVAGMQSTFNRLALSNMITNAGISEFEIIPLR